MLMNVGGLEDVRLFGGEAESVEQLKDRTGWLDVRGWEEDRGEERQV